MQFKSCSGVLIPDINSNYMKKLQNLSLVMLALAGSISFNSCSDDDEQAPEVDLNATALRADLHVNTSALPQNILDYIVQNYPGMTIREAEIEDNNNYEVKLNNDLELIFDSEGNFLGEDTDDDDNFGDEDMSVDEVPQKIKDFISTYFPGATIVKAEKENNGNFEIELSNDEELIFDAQANFLGLAIDEDENEDEDDEDISVSELPQNVRDYITANYPDNTIIEAEREDDGFEVTLNNGVELKFDEDGEFVSADDNNGDDDNGGDDD